MGYDAGKKVSGIKRHTEVDSQGLPHAIAVITANVSKRKRRWLRPECCKRSLSRVQSLLGNSSYVVRPLSRVYKGILGDVSQRVDCQDKLVARFLQGHAQTLDRFEGSTWPEKNRRL